MAAQLSYSIKQPVATAGALFALATADIVSRSVETVAGAAFGVAVSRGTDKDNQMVIGGADYLGITVRDLGREGAANTGAIKYSEKETAAILRSGYIWAICPAGCVPGNAVKFTNATGVLDSGAPGAGETAIAGAVWDSTAAAGELAVIRLS